MIRGVLILITAMLLMDTISNANAVEIRDGKIHDVLRQVLKTRLAEEDLAKQQALSQRTSKPFDFVQKILKAQMDAEDSRKYRGNMKPVAHDTVRKALSKALKNEHRFDKHNRALHQAVRQAVMNGLLVEHNPRSGSRVIHDAVRQAVKVETGAKEKGDHFKNNAVDDALVNYLLQQNGPKKIHNLLRHVLKMHMEEEDISGKADQSVHNRAEQVLRDLLADKDTSSAARTSYIIHYRLHNSE